MNQTPQQPELFRRARQFAGRTAIIDRNGRWSYGDLLTRSEAVAGHLVAAGVEVGDRVAYLVEPGFGYVATQWGIWMAGAVAVPLAVSHPEPELEYTLEDSGASAAVASARYAGRLEAVVARKGVPLLRLDQVDAADGGPDLPDVPEQAAAMILYTSGTTSRPKGVVSRHSTIRAQVTTLVDAWGWTEDDHILLVLPLHHVHGIINVLTCALWSGGICTMHEGFDAEAVWGVIESGDLSVFMAVPTVYSHLIRAWEAASQVRRSRMTAGCRGLRLMVSGSAALPVSVLERWKEISGHTLLERYGMTEIGMALSNPLEGERRPGHVGQPLPGVELRLVADDGSPVESGSGQIEVRGPSVFNEYWNRPAATREAFREGWFQTGDVAELDRGYYRILGRSSVDILKTGGYKVSALEIEEVLRRHPAVRECAVVGLQDEEWGEVVCAAIVAGEELLEGDALRAWAAEQLAPYKLPRRWKIVPDLPRNAMGKVTKPAVKQLFADEG